MKWVRHGRVLYLRDGGWNRARIEHVGPLVAPFCLRMWNPRASYGSRPNDYWPEQGYFETLEEAQAVAVALYTLEAV